MSRRFYFQLRREDKAKKQLQSRSIHVMAAILMLVYGLQYLLMPEISWLQILAVVPPSFLLILLVLFKRSIFSDINNNRIFRILEMGFLLMGSMHFLQKDQLAAALIYFFVCAFLFVVMWMENRIFQPQYIDFEEDQIRIELPLTTKRLSWREVQKVTMKNHYLTLHADENHYRQYKVIDALTPQEWEEFQLFCQEKITPVGL